MQCTVDLPEQRQKEVALERPFVHLPRAWVPDVKPGSNCIQRARGTTACMSRSHTSGAHRNLSWAQTYYGAWAAKGAWSSAGRSDARCGKSVSAEINKGSVLGEPASSTMTCEKADSSASPAM